jgi:hypothetical protein
LRSLEAAKHSQRKHAQYSRLGGRVLGDRCVGAQALAAESPRSAPAAPGLCSLGVPLDSLGAWGLDDPLPTPARQLDNLIIWIGDHQEACSDGVFIEPYPVAAWIGALIDRENPGAAIDWLNSTPQFSEAISGVPDVGVSLTFAGWQRYEVLKRTVVDGREAFIALRFNDVGVDHAVETCFKPAALRAGFNLRRMTDGQGAGLIDDQMRVAIRTAKFVIADLTLGSHGAYWEAGFAEGLGKPVIYTCRNDDWTQHKSHFDTNHLVTVVWDPTNLTKAERELAAAIRATLPSDAKMQD